MLVANHLNLSRIKRVKKTEKNGQTEKFVWMIYDVGMERGEGCLSLWAYVTHLWYALFCQYDGALEALTAVGACHVDVVEAYHVL